MGTTRHQQGRQPLQHVRASAGRRRHDRAARSGRRSGRGRRHPSDKDRLAPGKAARGGRVTAPLRGKRGKERRLGDRIATELAARHPAIDPKTEVDFDIGDAEASIEDARDAERRPACAVSRAGAAANRGGAGGKARAETALAGSARGSGRGAGRRPPDLSALPPLLAATGSFGSLRDRLAITAGAAPATGRQVGRHAGLTSVPHGAKSYLAATLALVAGGERLLWIARDAEIGDRVAEELAAWLGDEAAVTTLEPRTALAYIRRELVADETAAR